MLAACLLTCRELGVLVLHLEEMLRAFLPSPQRCLQAITNLLPKLTAEVRAPCATRLQLLAWARTSHRRASSYFVSEPCLLAMMCANGSRSHLSSPRLTRRLLEQHFISLPPSPSLSAAQLTGVCTRASNAPLCSYDTRPQRPSA